MLEPGAGPMALPCPECPEEYLSNYLASPTGALIQGVLNLDFCLQVGLAVAFERVGYPEFLLLRQLNEERNQYDIEQLEKSRGKH